MPQAPATDPPPSTAPLIVEFGAYAVLRVCGWCSAAAQRLDMQMWAAVPIALVRGLRAAGLTSDGLCPNCDRRHRQRLGLAPPGVPGVGVLARGA